MIAVRSDWLHRVLHRLDVRVAAIAVATSVCMALAFYTVDVGVVGDALGGIMPRYATLAAILILFNALVPLRSDSDRLGRCG